MSNLPIIITQGDPESITFEVPSSTDSSEWYMVTWDIDNGWFCDCPGYMRGKHLCKHILACKRFIDYLFMASLNDLSVFNGGGLVGSD